MLGFLDKLANIVQHEVDTAIQQRIAVLVILVSLLLLPYGFFAGEPLFVFEMSALALTLTGITWLASLGAQRAVEEAEDS